MTITIPNAVISKAVLQNNNSKRFSPDYQYGCVLAVNETDKVTMGRLSSTIVKLCASEDLPEKSIFDACAFRPVSNGIASHDFTMQSREAPKLLGLDHKFADGYVVNAEVEPYVTNLDNINWRLISVERVDNTNPGQIDEDANVVCIPRAIISATMLTRRHGGRYGCRLSIMDQDTHTSRSLIQAIDRVYKAAGIPGNTDSYKSIRTEDYAFLPEENKYFSIPTNAVDKPLTDSALVEIEEGDVVTAVVKPFLKFDNTISWNILEIYSLAETAVEAAGLSKDDVKAAKLSRDVIKAAKPEGQKFDADKLRFDLIDPGFEAVIAEVLTHGADKYGANNWQKVEDAENRYYAALRRHVNAKRQGELIDKDSKLSHLGHAATNIMFLYWLEKQELVKEDANEKVNT